MKVRLSKSFALLFLGSVFISMPFTNINADEWIKTYEGGGLQYVEQIKDGGYILLGGKEIWDSTSIWLVWLVKTDSVGDTLWTRTYGDTGKLVGKCVQQTKDGGYIIAGEVYPSRYALVIKTDSLGDTLWTQKFGNGTGGAGYRDHAKCVQQAEDGGYVVVGATESYSPWVGFDVWLIKLDSLGNKEWWKTYGVPGGGSDKGYWVERTYDGGYIICADIYLGGGNWTMWLIKTDSLGDSTWTKVYSDVDEHGVHVQCTYDSSYVITGYGGYTDSLTSYLSGFLKKVDQFGITQWTKNFHFQDYALDPISPYCVKQTYDSGYAVTGWAYHDHWFLLKTNSLGDSLWSKMYDGGGKWVVQTPDSGYTMVGTLNSIGTCLIHTYASVGVEEEREKVSPLNLEVFPNIAVKRLAIKYNTQKGIDAQLKLYDLSGREIYSFTPFHQISWSIPEDLNSGCYFLTLKAGSYKETVKVFILK